MKKIILVLAFAGLLVQSTYSYIRVPDHVSDSIALGAIVSFPILATMIIKDIYSFHKKTRQIKEEKRGLTPEEIKTLAQDLASKYVLPLATTMFLTNRIILSTYSADEEVLEYTVALVYSTLLGLAARTSLIQNTAFVLTKTIDNWFRGKKEETSAVPVTSTADHKEW